MQPTHSALSRTAVLASIAALILSTLATPVSAAGRSAADTIRYAAVQTCKLKGGSRGPCGGWRLAMRGGGTVRLPDARTTPRDARGKVRKEQAAPIAVSGDGTTVAYFRKSDDRLVVRRLGGEAVVVPNAPAKGVGMDDLALYLSRTGDRLAVEVAGGPRKRPTLVYDLSEPDAGPGEIPRTLAFQGFGDESALAAELSGDDITRLVTFPADDEPKVAVRPPRVVADNAPYGLAPDGTTVAFFSGSGGTAALRLYDLETGAITRGIPVRLDGADLPEVVTWTGENQVTAHVSRIAEGGRTDMRVLQIDTETGGVSTRDSYTIRADAFTYAARGA
ncbi:hypothetical protein AB0K60_07475 [Thermopolyspora sp. NPDC052614]|uniref:hypothetical protein n=1 Tax=Thermopolyspora sp. NPDC052614 TaxID=3155682 RepID=UPI003414808E